MSDQIEDNEDDFEIEVIDDTPEPDRGKVRRPDDVEPEIPDDDEIQGYSDNVQKRIRKLRYEYHEERRSKEEAQREKEEAIRFAEAQRQEAERLRRMIEEGEGVLIGQAKQRIQVQLEQAKAKLKIAYETGDSDALAEAQMKLADLKNEEYRVSSYSPRPVQPAPQPQYNPQVTSQAPEVRKPSPRAAAWAEENKWFGSDDEMTALALGVHESIIKNGTVEPDSEQYYNAINSAVRKRFPEKFGGSEFATQRRTNGNLVAPSGRSTSNSVRKVTLTTTQVALAKRLGLTPEQYAAQMLKDRSNG